MTKIKIVFDGTLFVAAAALSFAVFQVVDLVSAQPLVADASAGFTVANAESDLQCPKLLDADYMDSLESPQTEVLFAGCGGLM